LGHGRGSGQGIATPISSSCRATCRAQPRFAAGLAGLAEDGYEVRYVERELEFAELLALGLVQMSAPVLGALRLGPALSPEFQRILEIAAEPFRWVDSLNDPKNLYAYCFCEVQ